jgi:dienelactone hydrolase
MSTINRHGIAMPFKQALVAVFIFVSMQSRASGIAGGEWVGGSDLFESPAYMHLDISLGDQQKGVINIPQWKVVKRPLQTLRVNDDSIYFEIPSTTGVPFIARGKITNGVIEGAISRGDKKGKFHLISIKKVAPDVLAKYVGCYEIPDPKNKGSMIPTLISYSATGYLRFVNLADGSTTALLPGTNNKFFFAGSIMTSPVPSNTISFIEDAKGNTAKFTVHIEGLSEQHGTKVFSYHVEALQASTNDHSLAATLLLPAKEKKHPVVIVVPGSGSLNRDEITPYEEINTFISNGFGLLIYDKQGTGQSGGDWQSASFEQLSDDVLAFVEKLKSREDVDRSKIGVWGISQGASIAPIAASQSKDISFMIMQSGGGITPPEAEINEQVARMQVQKFSDTLINDAIAFMKLQFKAVNNRDYWDSLQALIPSVNTQPWFRYAWGGLPKDHWLWKWWQPVVEFDPGLFLQKINIPVLVIFGTNDQYVPKDSLDGIIFRITDAFDKAGNRSVTVAKFENANHEIFVKTENGLVLAPGYDETLRRFILKIK